MVTSIVFFLLYILPFVILPFGVTQFETPKVILAEGLILFLFVFSLFTNKVHSTYNRLPLLMLIGIVLLTLFDLLIFRTSLSFFGNVFRMQGIFLLWFLMGFSLLSGGVTLRKVPWSIYVAILIGEFISLFFLPINESGRYVGTLGEPNALAAFVLFVWPCIFFGIKKFGKKEITTFILSLLLVGGILFFTQSRSAIIGFTIQLVFIFLLRKNVSRIKIVLICLLIYIGSYTLPFLYQAPHENRAEIWQSAVFAGSVSPLIGQGFGNTEIALQKSAKALRLPIQNNYVDSAHNIFLDFYVQGGIIGLGLFVGIIGYAIFSCIKRKDNRNLVLLFGLLTTLSFNPASIIGLLGLWWLIGQSVRRVMTN